MSGTTATLNRPEVCNFVPVQQRTVAAPHVCEIRGAALDAKLPQARVIREWHPNHSVYMHE